MAQEFTELERSILRICQADLPDSLTPFADIAARVGTTEDVVLALVQRLCASGAIRRFGASLRHQNAGWASNCMVGWDVSGLDGEELGRKAAEHPNVSHCYIRPSSALDWPYELYTMVHGRSDEECERVIGELKAVLGTDRCLALRTRRELKKISPTYF